MFSSGGAGGELTSLGGAGSRLMELASKNPVNSKVMEVLARAEMIAVVRQLVDDLANSRFLTSKWAKQQLLMMLSPRTSNRRLQLALQEREASELLQELIDEQAVELRLLIETVERAEAERAEIKGELDRARAVAAGPQEAAAQAQRRAEAKEREARGLAAELEAARGELQAARAALEEAEARAAAAARGPAEEAARLREQARPRRAALRPAPPANPAQAASLAAHWGGAGRGGAGPRGAGALEEELSHARQRLALACAERDAMGKKLAEAAAQRDAAAAQLADAEARAAAAAAAAQAELQRARAEAEQARAEAEQGGQWMEKHRALASENRALQMKLRKAEEKAREWARSEVMLNRMSSENARLGLEVTRLQSASRWRVPGARGLAPPALVAGRDGAGAQEALRPSGASVPKLTLEPVLAASPFPPVPLPTHPPDAPPSSSEDEEEKGAPPP
eukprot:tig00021432_g21242.t1